MIPASELNEWLATLPPVPDWPYLCPCVLCRMSRGEQVTRKRARAREEVNE